MKIWLLVLVIGVAAAVALIAAQGGQRRVSLVVRNGIVVTMDPANRVLQNGAVAIEGSDIVAVGETPAIDREFRGRDVIEAAGQIVLPGLINTHTHAPMVLYRGL